MRVIFNDLDDFLADLRLDARKIEPRVLRTITYGELDDPPHGTIYLLATAVVGGFVVELRHRVGRAIPERGPGPVLRYKPDAALQLIIEDLAKRIIAAAKDLKLEVRNGMFDPVGGDK